MQRTSDQLSEGFALSVRFVLRPGQEDSFDRLVDETTRQIAEHEPDTLVYACHSEPDAPQPTRVFYELYRNRQAFEDHERQPHVRHFLSKREDYVADLSVSVLAPAAIVGLTQAQA